MISSRLLRMMLGTMRGRIYVRISTNVSRVTPRFNDSSIEDIIDPETFAKQCAAISNLNFMGKSLQCIIKLDTQKFFK